MDNETLPYALAVIKLLKGVVYSDDKTVWNCLIQYQRDIKQHFSGIGIEVFVQESEGFAYLKQKDSDPSQEENLPPILLREDNSVILLLYSLSCYSKN
ncbi:DUF4194 domain-containing protein [Methanogenium cariaci]|uniref:DUF4194 domain-containing protein n=1 Tax=Methanogenium cariaci TaxID=2197 RepID=UPI0007841930|nr:DUF4194 domain-containing protein [Methanogenium cariaci]